MSFKLILIRFYYLLIHTDGNLTDSEISLGKKMIQVEAISEREFNSLLATLKLRDRADIYAEALEDLKLLEPEFQVRCIAWLFVLANSDGFMDRSEWQFIYKVYHKELNLSLTEISLVQKQLVKLTRNSSAT